MPSDLLVGRAVTVRDAAEADLDAITAIWNHEVLWTDATTDTEPRNARTQREWFERHPASYPIVVAARGDQVLAFGALSPYRPKPAFAWTVEDSVYVERGRRGAGLGRLILAELIRRARAHGHRSVLARITSGNAASIGLHARHAFRVVGLERPAAVTSSQRSGHDTGAPGSGRTENGATIVWPCPFWPQSMYTLPPRPLIGRTMVEMAGSASTPITASSRAKVRVVS